MAVLVGYIEGGSERDGGAGEALSAYCGPVVAVVNDDDGQQ